MTSANQVVYLTGAPATGKSSLSERLLQHNCEIKIFTYSKELATQIQTQTGSNVSQFDLRRKSSSIISREVVETVDAKLIEFVNQWRETNPIIIDSHPVTIEPFGFRVTAFKKQQLLKINPSKIICLFAPSEVIANRIKLDSGGRPLPSLEDLSMHTQLQCMVANLYSFEVGSAVYFLNSACTRDELLKRFCELTGLKY